MPGSSIDTLLSVVQSTQSAETPPRNAAAEPFAPALREAVEAQSPRPAPPSSSPRQSDADGSRDAATSGDDACDEGVDQAILGEDESASADDADAVQISEAGANSAPVDSRAVEEQRALTKVAAEGALEVIDVDARSAPPDETSETEGATTPKREGDRIAGGALAEDAPATEGVATNAKKKAPLPPHGKEATAARQSAEPRPDADDSSTGDGSAKSAGANASAGSEHSAERDAAKNDPRPRTSREESSAATTATGPSNPTIAASVAVPVEAAAATETAAVDDSAQPPVAESAAGLISPTTTAPATADRLAASRSPLIAAPGTGEHDAAPPIARSRFVQRVEGAMRRAAERDGRVQVRLAPPELGSLRIELTLHNGVMSARLETDTAAAKQVLLDNLPALRERLAQQDIRIEKFDVDVRRDPSGNGGNAPHDRPEDQPAPRPSAARSRASAIKNAELRPLVRGTGSGASTAPSFDVRI